MSRPRARTREITSRVSFFLPWWKNQERELNREKVVEFVVKNLFWVRVEPFGQTELSLPAEEEDKLDRHCKVENKTSSSSPYLPWLVAIGIVSAKSLWNPSCCWQSARRIHFATFPPPVCPVCPVCPAVQSRYRGVPPAWLADKGQTWTQTHNKHKFNAISFSFPIQL